MIAKNVKRMFRPRFTRNFFREQERMMNDFMREFDRSLEAIDPDFGPMTSHFNDEFFLPLTYENPEVS